LLPDFIANAKKKISITFSEKAEIVWAENNNRIIPWANETELVNSGLYDYPILCT